MTSPPAVAGDWPQWGGPNRNFQVASPELADSWDEAGPPRVWSRSLGQGFSAVVAVAGILYTMYGEDEEEVVVAIDARTGTTVWEYRYPVELHHQYATRLHWGPSSTPLVAHGHVIAIGYTGMLHALDAKTGKLQWSHDLIQDFGGQRLRFGYSASPLLYKDHVVVLIGGRSVGAMALEPRDGSVVWRSAPFDVNYASPIAIRVDGQDQIIFLSAEEILAVDAKDGQLLWRAPCRNGFANNASDPIWNTGNLLWVASQPGCEAHALRLAWQSDETYVERLWTVPEITLHYWNGIRIDDTVYASVGPSGTDFAAVKIETGEVLWRQAGWLEKARAVYAGDKTILLDEQGTLALAQLSPHELEILSQHILLDGEAWTVPTLVGTVLYVRDTSVLMALELGPGPL